MEIIYQLKNTANNGEIVVALIGEEATVKTFYKEKDHIRLQPENSALEPIIVPMCEILGKVAGVFRKLQKVIIGSDSKIIWNRSFIIYMK